MRAITRLTNASSKRLDKHLRHAGPVLLQLQLGEAARRGADEAQQHGDAAMAAGLTDRPATYADLVELIDARAPAVNYARKYRPRKPSK